MKGRHSFILGAPLIVALLVPLRSPPAEAPARTGSLVGQVTSLTRQPVVGARVTVLGTGQHTVSGANGRYQIDSVPEGTVRVRAVAHGYESKIVRVNVVPGKVTTADFRMTATPFALDEMVANAPQARRQKLSQGMLSASAPVRGRRGFNTEEYAHIIDNRWQAPGRRPLSTFSIDVDAASYTNIRRFIRDNHLPPKDAVRIEEMINYFPFDYPEPVGGVPFSVTTELADAPWNSRHKLALIGLQGQRLHLEDLPPNNLVFLLDVSGSMGSPNKLPLVKAAFRLLVDQLRPEDRVAIVVYAGAAGLVLPSTSGSERDRILDAIERLSAGGSTAGGQGITLAYQAARQHFVPGGNNRVILATDGDFNVGVSSEGDLIRLIEHERTSGVFLTVLGFGTGNLKDSKMEQLADHGNGHFAYVDNLLEAKKVLVNELGATLMTIAKDVKIQVEFNPTRVAAYRLIGYENRLLADEDFNDDTKDAGELGAGHAVTALYEIVPVGQPLDVPIGSVDSLRYQDVSRTSARESDDWFTVALRYKAPTGIVSQKLERVVRSSTASPSVNFRFASAVAGVGMVLRDSEFKGTATFARMATRARRARGKDPHGYRAEFVQLVEAMDLIAREQAVAAQGGEMR